MKGWECDRSREKVRAGNITGWSEIKAAVTFQTLNGSFSPRSSRLASPFYSLTFLPALSPGFSSFFLFFHFFTDYFYPFLVSFKHLHVFFYSFSVRFRLPFSFFRHLFHSYLPFLYSLVSLFPFPSIFSFCVWLYCSFTELFYFSDFLTFLSFPLLFSFLH